MEEFSVVSSHWSIKSRNTKHAYAEIRIMKTSFIIHQWR